MGPIRVLYGQKSLYGAQVGPKWDKCPESAHMVPIYTCLLVSQSLPIWDLYRSYMGKKAYMGPEWNKCPDSAHMGPTYTCLLGSYMGKKAYMGPEWNKCPDSAHMGPTYTCLLGCLQNEWMDVDKPCTAILLRQRQELIRFW